MASWSSTTSNPAASSTATGPFWSALRVAHFIAQNAHHQTDTGIPDRHTGLNPRALGVQLDLLERFLCFDSPQLHQLNHDDRPEISGLPVDPSSATGT